jgi:hypothetical protein
MHTVQSRPTRVAAVSWRSTRRLPTFAPTQISDVFSDGDWATYRRALAAVRQTGVAFALGGGLAVAFYTGHWRSSRDLDLYVLQQDAPVASAALLGAGLQDYFSLRPYHRGWIFRAAEGEAIVDVIWALANGAGWVERRWLIAGARARIDDVELPLLAPEEILWSKIHVLQRDRCDWPDLLNLLYTTGPQLDWSRLLHLLAGDERLLASLLLLFTWLAPARAHRFPNWLWPRLGLASPVAPAAVEPDNERVRLLDTRPWFTDVTPP